ncbi:Uncharacterised protein [Enterococcus malodoratus]|uniref:Uncharacterized protein n=1 Tax=Enterococcus malodoratus ATCC 43197 TaxID=1158601 RepID=A0ABN0LU16_9ENTE|nr:hypothetical protein I585_01815 [Enterococcus malodoratus ATCC 43197]SPW69662.1 Uncharacterised protein [Enterococcus malodoratus]STD65546.1 Uncharacterised protein [Enterococcus malodoratus]
MIFKGKTSHLSDRNLQIYLSYDNIEKFYICAII